MFVEETLLKVFLAASLSTVMKFLKLYKILSADASPSAIGFAVLFGLTLGFIPLSSGLAICLMAGLLIFRVQISTALLALGLGKALSLLGVAALFEPVGAMLLEPEGFHGFWTWFLNLPLVAWFGFHIHAVLGGAVLGLVLGLLLYYPVCRVVSAYREFLHGKLSSNKFFLWLTNFWIIKALRFVFVGKGAIA